MSAGSQIDVVVVGSGAGGGAAAWRLSDLGLRVLVLEAGPEFDPFLDYRLNRPDWELTLFPVKPGSQGRHSFGPMQPLTKDRDPLRSWGRLEGKANRTGSRFPWRYHHVRGLGGTTLHFTGEAHRLNPASMSMHSRFGVAADWPLDYAELEPYYEMAENVLGVAAAQGTGKRQRRRPAPLPPHPASFASRKVMEAAASLGVHWEANPLAVLSRSYDGRPPCNYCGGCTHGCPRTDKGSVDQTFLRRARATGRCAVLTDSPVLRLEAGPDDRVAAVEYLGTGDTRKRVIPRVLVLACGAVETPRLLLHSANRHAPDGLANETGQVGRHFMETLFWRTSGLHPEHLGSHRGLPSDIICWDFNSPDAIPGIPGGYRLACGSVSAGLAGPVSYARRVVPGWGSEHKRAMRDQLGRVVTIEAVGESLPNPRSYIDLDPEQTDGQGLALARINSFLPALEIDRLAAMAERCRALARAAGAGDLVGENGTYDYFSATHVFGTCRMGRNPAESVVNAAGRSHRWRNLYVADASVFPSSGGGEAPSLTIEALAIRTADHIREALARREV